MRTSCFECVIKHIAQAHILMHEYFSDKETYAIHRMLAIGHLAEAEDEVMAADPVLAVTIRLTRKSLEGGMRDFDVCELLGTVIARQKKTNE